MTPFFFCFFIFSDTSTSNDIYMTDVGYMGMKLQSGPERSLILEQIRGEQKSKLGDGARGRRDQRRGKFTVPRQTGPHTVWNLSLEHQGTNEHRELPSYRQSGGPTTPKSAQLKTSALKAAASS